MKKIIFKIFLFLSLLTSYSYSELLQYISPGFQLLWGSKHLSIGFKLSYGIMPDIHKTNVCNGTIGFLFGDRKDFYIEFQDLPIPIVGGGAGLTLSKIKGVEKIIIGPRLSVFAGFVMYGDYTFTFFIPKDIRTSISPFQYGLTSVIPVPISGLSNFGLLSD